MSCHIFGVNLLRRNSWETLGRLEEHTDYKFLSLCHYNLKKKKNRNCSAIFWSMVMVLTLKYHSAHSWSHEGPQIVLGVLKIVVSGVSPFFFFLFNHVSCSSRTWPTSEHSIFMQLFQKYMLSTVHWKPTSSLILSALHTS